MKIAKTILGVDLLRNGYLASSPPLPLEARNRLEDIVQALLDAYLSPPQADEEFESPGSCLRRLQGCVLSKDFAIVKPTGQGKGLAEQVEREAELTTELPERIKKAG
ncbi:hypothetical protein GJ744_005651 [Endocarpon pusillum]|uniref:Uncharacterized protein n=1 Tax=Endocarpon pusillum TaxID=364733 RepID=A0A8H7DX09_9EURO|nr:hypothetical protein GJ744_005651 [Endocarpon pusillum]